jgi:hypothetical protein
VKDPSLDEIGDPANLNNYLPDSGATQHMTPRREDLYDAVEGQNLGVEVADGYIIRLFVVLLQAKLKYLCLMITEIR